MFQFHKVRLKVHVIRVYPFGYRFQFHKVRLKDNYLDNYLRPFLFQFHKVRLKVARPSRHGCRTCVSIP